MDELRPISLSGPKVLMLARTPEGHLWELRSEDDGETWSAPARTTIVQPDAPPMVFKLSGNKTLICLHHNRYHGQRYNGLSAKDPAMADRSEVWFSTSTDDGRTWSEPRFIFANALEPSLGTPFRDYNCSYIDMVEENGEVHLFVPHRWERVLHLRFREVDLKTFPTASEIGQTGRSTQ
jgi:hypothetical protein